MTGTTTLKPVWQPRDVDAASSWAASGAQWLTADGADVPVDLVRAVAGQVAYLDAHGAGLDALFPSGGLGLLAERSALLEFGRPAAPSGPGVGAASCGGASRILRCADGSLAVTLARPDDLASLPAWLGVDPDDDRADRSADRGADGSGEGVAVRAAPTPWDAIAGVVSTLECRPLVAQGVELGLACSVVGEVADDRAVLVEQLGDAAARPLAGAVVANLSSLWAGPLTGDILARLGARVINVESTQRPDGARQTPAFFEALHGRCSSVALDLHTDDGRWQLGDLLAAADVVIEGSRPRALEQMGVAAAEVVRSGPKVWLSITGHGRSDPHGRRVGFGDDAAAAGGLVGRVDGSPVFVADAIADPLSGLTAAAAIVQLLGSPGRFLVDVALARVARSVVGERRPASTSEPPRPPSARIDRGRALPLGRDTDAVLAEFGIGR